MNLRELLEKGMAQHQAGNLPEAEKFYREALQHNPNHPDALHLLGAVAGETGRVQEGIELISRAIAVYPSQAVYHCNLSEMQRRAGNIEGAVSAARQAIALNPKFARGYSNMGLALAAERRWEDAASALRRALEIDPHFVFAMEHLAKVLGSLKQYEDAVAVMRRVVQFKPNSADALSGLGIALRENDQLPEAIEVLRRALAIEPGNFASLNGLGVALALMNQLDDAIALFREAIRIDPNNAVAVKNLGVALAERGEFEESLAKLERAIELNPDFPEAHGNLAMVSLMNGRFARGWVEYEWRWRANLTFLATPRELSQPRWDGKPLGGRTILLHAEQGFGDTMQFVRYVPMVAAMGGRVIVEVQRDLVRLIRRAFGAERVIAAADPLPRFDCHCPLLSLPLAFRTDLNSIPAKIPYLLADPAAAARWKERVDTVGAGLKIGFVWAGNPKNLLDRKRSIPFEQMLKLLRQRGVRFFSLQKNAGNATWPADVTVVDWTSDLRDFDDTAALVANLDLVISVDTAVAHLAGAMGKRTWLMIPYVPDWRWLLRRPDSPWYPTVRIFRQSVRGDWGGVVEAVGARLGDEME
jgi:tetratricopeptide (TPR) repeat protein